MAAEGRCLSVEIATDADVVRVRQATRELVIALPGAIAFLPADEVGSGMKVMRINGKLPGEAGYPLQ